MTQTYLWSFFAFFITLLGSGILLVKHEWSKKNIWRILAFASGILLSVAFTQVLPEASSLAKNLAGTGVLTSFLIIFAIEGFSMMHSSLEYAEECEVHMVGWFAFASLAVHSLFDGMAIAIAFEKNISLGRSVALAILIHKLTDGITLTGLLLSSKYSVRKCFQSVFLLALATPIGAFIFHPFSHFFSDAAMGWWLGFIAGIFFYVGAADILPRLHKVKDIYCLVSFALGLLIGGMGAGI